MSKLSSQDVIDRGNYLETGFDPSTLTVIYLRAILQNHDVGFPSNASKAQLIKAFQENIVPNAKKYKKARTQNAAIPSDASDILDGETGEPLEPPRTTRRISRKSTSEALRRVPSTSPTRKGRKTLATPRTSTKPLRAEDEDLSDQDRMASSTRLIDDTPRKPRRVSQKWGTGDATSVWEDNNPFQKETPDIDVGLSRSVSKPRKSRGRPSSGVDFAPPTAEQNIFPEPGSLNLGTYPSPARKARTSVTPVRPSSRLEASTSPYSVDGEETMDDSQERNGYPHVEGESQNDIVTEKIASLGNGTLVPKTRSAQSFGWRQLLTGLLVAVSSFALYGYKTDSASIGYCDTGKSTNAVVLQHLLEIEAEKSCRDAIVKRTDAGLLPDPEGEACKTSILPRATQCTPCPPHAICSGHTITCEPAYVLKHSIFSSIPLVDALLDGFPGLGPIALPPTCVADVKRRQKVGKMAGAIENKLSIVRGDRICAGVVSTGGDAQDAAAFGMTMDEIKASLTRRINSKAIPNFDDIFAQAISELKNNKLLVSVRDVRGQEHFASIRGQISYVCQAKLATLSAWEEWKLNIIFAILVALAFVAARSNLAKRTMEGRRVKGLVKEALERVKEQEARHYLDSVTYPTPALSSLQLRDEMMADEHSIATRVRVWEQVEKVVEENSNVRSNMEITTSGDEGRVWSWIGAGSGRGQFIDASPNGRRVM